MENINWKLARHDIFQINSWIYQGGYPNEAAEEELLRLGVTAVINVSGSADNSVTNIPCYSYPFPDLQPIPVSLVKELITQIAELGKQGKKIFIHCSAGQNRSPTVLWLFYLACGISKQDAKKMISNNTLDSVPGHPDLVNEQIIHAALHVGKNMGLSSSLCMSITPELKAWGL